MANKNIILSVKLKNALSKLNRDLTVDLHNIIINGDRRGCSGFIQNKDNGTNLYLNTELSCGSTKYLYRYAEHRKDYRGLSNRYAGSFDELFSAIDSSLNKSGSEIR